MSKVFIVGKIKPGKDCWEFQGVFSTKEKALNACKGHRDYFVGPAIMDEVVTGDSVDWPGAYYPAYTEVVCDMAGFCKQSPGNSEFNLE